MALIDDDAGWHSVFELLGGVRRFLLLPDPLELLGVAFYLGRHGPHRFKVKISRPIASPPLPFFHSDGFAVLFNLRRVDLIMPFSFSAVDLLSFRLFCSLLSCLFLVGHLRGFLGFVSGRVDSVGHAMVPYLATLACVAAASLLQAALVAVDCPKAFPHSQLHPLSFLGGSASRAVDEPGGVGQLE